MKMFDKIRISNKAFVLLILILDYFLFTHQNEIVESSTIEYSEDFPSYIRLNLYENITLVDLEKIENELISKINSNELGTDFFSDKNLNFKPDINISYDFDFVYKEGKLDLTLNQTNLNSFNLSTRWINLDKNLTKISPYYSILFSIYSNENLIIRLNQIGEFNSNKNFKQIQLIKFNSTHFNYSLALTKIDFYKNLIDLPNITSYSSIDKDLFKIDNIFLKKKNTITPSIFEQNVQIFIFSLTVFIFLFLIFLLIYLKKKFNLNQLKKKNLPLSHTVFKNPSFRITDFDQNSRQNSFDERFIANTARLSLNDTRINSFANSNNLNQVDTQNKFFSHKSSFGSVLEQSLATIKKHTSLRKLNILSPDISKETNKNNLTFFKQEKYSKKISITDFLANLIKLKEQECSKLNNEFMEMHIISNGLNQKLKSQKIAKKARNLKKNSHNIFPYDHSRVVLQIDKNLELSDYINASYIPGLLTSKDYIAAQTPISSMVYNFWKMCWQEDVKFIIMCNDAYELNASEKTYWPERNAETQKQSKNFVKFLVDLEEKKILKNFILRTFTLKSDNICKSIYHFELTGWKEFQVSNDAVVLVDFIEYFYKKYLYENEDRINQNVTQSPILVHCSNGVGKTGVFIAVLRTLVQLKLKKDNQIDIFGYAVELREARPLMIQNETQYKFTYECIALIIRKMYPYLIKQLEFESTFDEINLKEKCDFDTNNNLEINDQVSLIECLRNKTDKNSNFFLNSTFAIESNS